MSLTDRRIRAAALALVLLAWGLRLYRIDAHPLRGDEAFSAVVASGIGTETATAGLISDPLAAYDLALSLWVRLTGDGEFALRFLSALGGTLSVPLLIGLARRLGLGTAAVLGAGLLAINPYQIFHSQDVRSYALWMALSLASISLFLLAAQQNRRSYWVGYGLLAWLALLFHFADGLILTAMAVFFLAVRWGLPSRQGDGAWAIQQAAARQVTLRWGLVLAAVLIAYALYLVAGPAQLVPAAAVGTSPLLWTMANRALTAVTFGEVLTPATLTPLLFLAAPLLVLGLASAWLRDRRIGLFLLLWIVVPLLGIFAYIQWQPIFRARYLNATAPALYLAYALGILAVHRLVPRFKNGLALAGAAIVVAPAVLALADYYAPDYQKAPNWPALATELASVAEAADLVAATYPDPALEYYWQGSGETTVLPRSANPSDEVVHRTLQDLLLGHDRLWLVSITAPEWDPERKVHAWLDRLAVRRSQEELSGFKVLRYDSPRVFRGQIQNQTLWAVGDIARLVGFDLRVAPADQAGSLRRVHLVLYWEALRSTDTSYHVFAHVIGRDDRIAGQQDNPPQGGRFPTTLWFPGDLIRDEYVIALGPDAPPGTYSLRVGMYDFNSGHRLGIFDSRGEPAGDAVVLSSFSIQD